MGFVATRWTLDAYDPIWSNSLRYIFAALFSLVFLLFTPPKKLTLAPLYCGIILLIALQLQTIGLAYTSLAKSGFLTVFYAVFTPILTYFILKQRFRKTYWFLLLLAMTGILFLCNLDMKEFNIGDLLTLGSAFVFSFHILAVDKLGKDHPSIQFNLLQCIYMGILAIPTGFLLSGPVSLAPLLNFKLILTPSPLLGFVVLSLFSSILAFTFQVHAQKNIPPHVVSLTFLMESIFAALFGYLFFKEQLSSTAVIGCLMVMISVAFIPKFATIKARN